MARIRTIKPEFFTSEDICGLTPMARLLYIALWCEADREGRLTWKPRTFKLRYFPADRCDIDALADELVSSGLVVPYGSGLAFIPKFASHQHVNPREAASNLPDPDASPRVTDASLRVNDAQVGREGKGRSNRKDASVDTSSADADLFAGVSQSVIDDFKELRRKKKAPITATAVEGIRREAAKAGVSLEAALRTCCERGWTGFNSEWAGASSGAINGHVSTGNGRREL